MREVHDDDIISKYLKSSLTEFIKIMRMTHTEWYLYKTKLIQINSELSALQLL